MNKKQIALILATSLVLTGASGCKNQSNYAVANENGQVISQTMPSKTNTFKPGTHLIRYNSDISRVRGNSYENISVEIPEGYEIFDIELTHYSHGLAGTYEVPVYFFINTKTVEATGTYNEETGTYEYNTPGEPVTTKTLKPGE